MIERKDDWNPPESWKGITCIMMIHADHQNKEIPVAAQCPLSTVKQSGMYWRIAMETTRLWLEEGNIADDLIVMVTTRLWLEESNIADDLIAFVQQNSTKICILFGGRPRHRN